MFFLETIEFDFVGEYKKTRSLNKVVKALAAQGIVMSRNTVRSRIAAAGGDIKGKGTRPANFAIKQTTFCISKRQSTKLARLVEATRMTRSEIVRAAIALWFESGEPESVKSEEYPDTMSVWVTPDTLARLEGSGKTNAEQIRSALDFINLRRLKTRQSKESI
jgi:hypothetical protein